MDRKQLQLLQAALQEKQRRDQQSKPSILSSATESQRAFIEDPALLKAALCTRRAGKTWATALYLFIEALSVPKAKCLFIGLTRESAERIILTDMLEPIQQRFGIKASYNRAKMRLTLVDNGSVIYILGIDGSEKEKAKLLGQKYRLVVVDEAGSFSIDLRDAVMRLRPAMASMRGTICLIGTPENNRNYFHDVTRDDPRPEDRGWSVHRWSFRDNPYERENQEALVAAMLEENPLVAETPSFRQHWLAEWTIDTDALVYRFRRDRNVVGTKEWAERKKERTDWLHVVGIDLGHKDHTAFVVYAFSPTDPDRRLYVIEAFSEPGMVFSDVAAYVRDLEAAYSPYLFIIDEANKQGVEEMRQVHGLDLVGTNKHADLKHVSIGLMNDDLTSGLIQVVTDSPDEHPLIKEWTDHIWRLDRAGTGRRKERKSAKHPNHLADAALYAWRDAFHHQSVAPAPPPPPRDSPEWQEQRRQRELRRIEAGAQRPWWQRRPEPRHDTPDPFADW